MALDTSAVIDGKYEIIRLLGEGGMGAVYEGLNVRIHRRVAIKVLHGNVAQNADAVHRFEREAQAAGRIGSQHIVEVLDMGDLPSGDRYMVMEFLAGESLADRIQKRGRLTPQELCPIASQLLEGLSAAHAAGIVHRDLKPDNVYLVPAAQPGQPEFVKILDFGISKFSVIGGEFSMTRTGAVMGTPYYMSPEQARGDALDSRTDLYAAGVILYEALSGQVPFDGETFNQLLFKIVLEEAPPLESLAPNVSPAFLEIVKKAMRRDVNERYQTASDFKAALHLWSKRDSVVPLGIPDPAPGYGTSLPAKTIAHGTATPEPWASTGVDLSPTSGKKKSPALFIAAAAAVIALGGGFALKMRADAAQERTAQAAVEAEKKLAAAALEKAEEEKRIAAEAATLAASEKKALELEKAKLEALEAKTEDPGTKTTASATTVKGKTPVVKGTAQPARPAEAPQVVEKKPSGTVTTGTGRPIRSSL